MEKSINISILGNCTTEYIASALKKECGKFKIEANIYNCPYNQYNQEILNTESMFYASKPELSILFLEGKLLFSDWYEFGNITSDIEKKLYLINSALLSITTLIEDIHSNCNTKILLNNFKVEYHSPIGILDGKFYPGLKDMFALLNQKLNEWAVNKNYVHIFDYCNLCAHYGHTNSADPKMYYIAKSPLSFSFINVLVKEYMRYILPVKYMIKKCLVLDLDNTLWGGIAGEDGISCINLDIQGVGRSYYDFQKEILNLYNRGIILAINSKNNMEDALAIIENHPHMLLRKHHFSCLKINWNDKAQNMREIAKELNIGIDSLVFFDDSPFERELIKSMVSEVTVVDLPSDTSKYAETLKNFIGFDLLEMTAEDINRNIMYTQNQQREELQQRFNSLDEYLQHLQIKLVIDNAKDFTIPRIAQLTQKTNQFNMTTKRYLEAEIKNMAASEDYLVLSCLVLDRFGDNGITGVCIVKLNESNAYIDTYLLSCRVLGRNIEFAFINKIISILRNKGIKIVNAPYIKTEKNKEREFFYPQAGFSKISADDDSEALYCFDESCTLKHIEYIKIVVGGA